MINNDNPFNSFTTEYKIYKDISFLVKYFKENKNEDPNIMWLDDKRMFDDYKIPVRRTQNERFKKRILDNYTVNFSISELEWKIFETLKTTKNETQLSRFNNFFSKSIPLLTEFHALYLNWFLKRIVWKREQSTEAIKKILLDESSIQRVKPLKINELALNINDRLLELHRTMTLNLMYRIYLRNLPQKIIKTKDNKLKAVNKVISVNLFQNPFKDNQTVKNPWRTKTKANYYMEKNGWDEEKRNIWTEDVLRDSFNEKQQKKKYMLHTVAPRHSFIIDYFFPGKFIYLLCVNVNTRKAFAIPINNIQEINEGKWIVPIKGNKTEETAVEQLKKLMKMTKVKHIMCDLEKAFISKSFKEFCTKNKIELNHYHKNNLKGFDIKESSRGNHGTLSILDRLCRTLRSMNNNLGNDENIPPNVMDFLLKEYNNSPHTTLSKLAQKQVSPNDVDKDKRLEDFICGKLMKENMITKTRDDWNVKGWNVRCFNEAGKFDKVKRKLLPGTWKVKGNEHGLFVCQQGENSIKVPRWMIKTSL